MGKIVIPLKENYGIRNFYDIGGVEVEVWDDVDYWGSRRFGLIDKIGKEIIPPIYGDIDYLDTTDYGFERWGFDKEVVIVKLLFVDEDPDKNIHLEENGNTYYSYKKHLFLNPTLETNVIINGRDQDPKLIGDVNGDGPVNIFDLVMVAGQFGQIGNGLQADVNNDGQINIFDLVIVANNFGLGQAAASPSMVEQVQLTTEQKRQIESAITQLKSQLVLTSPEEIALNLLKSIHPERLPTEPQLFPNYPNPFNPETWIPFGLPQDTNVSLTIYDMTGHQIRKIDVGHTLAGRYVTKDQSIYWDGRTETGEFVSSSTYFYQINAGDYHATRKMVILK